MNNGNSHELPELSGGRHCFPEPTPTSLRVENILATHIVGQVLDKPGSPLPHQRRLENLVLAAAGISRPEIIPQPGPEIAPY